MQVRLSSQKRKIIDHGTVFLFNKNADFTLNIVSENSFEMSLVIDFAEDSSQDSRIQTEFLDNQIKLTCINFAAEGTGMTTPLPVSEMDGKKIYFIFWSYLEGSKKNKSQVRKVEYTLYSE